MFANIRRYKVSPGRMAEVAARVENGLIPILRRQNGFIAYYAIDAGEDTAISFSLYAHKAGADAATKSAVQWVQQNVAELMSIPEITSGEVVASSIAGN